MLNVSWRRLTLCVPIYVLYNLISAPVAYHCHYSGTTLIILMVQFRPSGRIKKWDARWDVISEVPTHILVCPV